MLYRMPFYPLETGLIERILVLLKAVTVLLAAFTATVAVGLLLSTKVTLAGSLNSFLNSFLISFLHTVNLHRTGFIACARAEAVFALVTVLAVAASQIRSNVVDSNLVLMINLCLLVGPPRIGVVDKEISSVREIHFSSCSECFV